MGCADSKKEEQPVQELKIAPDPLIQRLRSTMRLQFNKNDGRNTYSFLHQSFSQQIAKNKEGKIHEDYSPFCCLMLPDKKQHLITIATCTLISPIMAVAPSSRLSNPEGFVYNQRPTFLGCCGGKNLEQKVKRMIMMKESGLAVLILQKPLWELGWCGLTFLESSAQIGNFPVLTVYNVFSKNDKQVIDEQSDRVISQKLEKVFCKESGPFEGKSMKKGENLLIKVIQRKPYLVGIQRGETCQFFSVELIKQLQKQAQKHLKADTERQLLKQMDIEKMQMQSAW